MLGIWRKACLVALGSILASPMAGHAQVAGAGQTEVRSSRAAGPTGTALPARDTVYVPIQPCRMFNSVVSGLRPINMRGNLSSQGGPAGGCLISADATALNVTIHAVSAQANGFIRTWAHGQPEPDATFMYFNRAMNVSNTGSVDVRTTAANAFDLRVAGGPTRVFIDVYGYHQAPLFAAVNANGTLHNGSRVVSTQRDGVGLYYVNFAVKTDSCAKMVTIGRHDTASPEYNLGSGAAFASSSFPGQVRVVLRNNAGTFIDSDFSIAITC